MSNALVPAQETDVAIVGTGFSGIAMGVQLKRAGINSFLMLEKAEDVGGTWLANTYPGAACDIPSHLYSFSFEPNPAWSRTFSPQSEILAYLKHCALKFGLRPHMIFGAHVEHARFDSWDGRWVVETRDGRIIRARSLALGNGALHTPSIPAIRGREQFQGEQFHSAQWNHGYNLDGKRVAVIGTGASSVQFVPHVVPRVTRLHLFQRTPPWIIPKPDRRFGEDEKSRFKNHPLWHRLYRALIYWGLESQAAGFVLHPGIMKGGEFMARRFLKKAVKDPVLREKLTPRFRMGCKRVLLSNDYFRAIQHESAELVTTGIDAITPNGIRTTDGVERKVDAILYGTGFDVTNYLTAINVVGPSGKSLNEAWVEKVGTYLGITVSGFPNLYLLMGPNTGLGHNSMIFMIEAQVRYAIQCINTVRRHKLLGMDVRPARQDEFQEELHARLQDTVWQSGGCRSWYQAADGRNPVLWPGFTFEYWLKTRKVDLSDYSLLGAGEDQSVIPLSAERGLASSTVLAGSSH